ncbi:MAG: SpoIIE family protein phosphatase [Thermoleophilaceae bacterium]
MARGAIDPSRKLYAAQVAVLAGVYYGAAKLGLHLAFATKSVTAIWPPTGIALAALVLGGFRLWPGVALGAFLANAWTGVPLYTVFGITAGNTLEALAGAYLLCRVADFRPALDRVRDVLALVGFAGVLSTTVSATIGVLSLLAGGEIDAGDFGSVWRTWWLGDMGGDLVVAPVLLIAAAHWPFRRAPGRPLEAAALVVTTVGIASLVFSTSSGLTYLVFPALIWASLRFWQPGAAGASLLVAAVAVTFTEHNLGPFSGHSPDDRLLLAQSFVGAAGVTALVLAAVITERRQIEDTVEYIAGTLQESLLPSTLPEVPGVESAVGFRPAGERHLVGGDFYDLFESGDGSWAAVIGDVCGKGAPAAAVTGLARYTLRAAAAHERLPSRILGLLNEAILHQRSPGEFCTVAYTRLDLDGGSGVQATVASGGHPLPLVLRAGGGVEAAGEYGTLLGVTGEPELADHTIDLAPGDALVLYTDGLTDAYAPGRILTSGDLVTVLEACTGGDAAAIAGAIQREVLDSTEAEPRDDIALLVLRVPDGGGRREVTARLRGDLADIARARRAIDQLESELDRALVTNLRLLVSELVTNSIRHSGAGPEELVELSAIVLADRVRVEVLDRGPGFEPRAVTPDRELGSGWGLYLVDQLADRWGVVTDGSTRVWFEIDR